MSQGLGSQGGEVKRPADAFVIRYYCTSACGGEYLKANNADGRSLIFDASSEELEQAGVLPGADPVLYVHQCNKCGKQLRLAKGYPSTAFVER